VRQQFEICQPGPVNKVRVDVNQNAPHPILRVQCGEPDGLEDRTNTTLIELHLYDGEKIAKFWIDASLTNQHRPRIRVAHNTVNGRATRIKDLVGTFREPRCQGDAVCW